MVRQLRTSAALGLLTLAAAGCGGSSVATYDREDRRITVRVGDEFRIALPSSPSIGDDWRLERGPDRDVLRLVADSWEGEEQPGGDGVASFVFAARSPGTAELTLFNCYRCVGDPAPTPENEPLSERLVFTITVRP